MAHRVCLTLFAPVLLVLVLAITLQVVCSALDINPLVQFTSAKLAVGSAITLNTLLDFQWHLLVLIGLLPLGLVWLSDHHVRVDFFYNRRSTRWKARINLLGNIVFAGPLFFLLLPASWNFMQRAWLSDEGSRNGGMNDLWLIKALLPIGISLLLVAVLIETIRLIRAAR